MQSTENEMLSVDTVSSANSIAIEGGGYEAVRYNAMKHGILSKSAVLPHEDHHEFADLLAAMIDEHQPNGITERQLIEELATVVWRKRRVLLAEGAVINRGVWSVTHERENKSTVRASVPLEIGMSYDTHDLPELLQASPGEIEERHRNAELDLAMTRKAAAILRKGGENAYEKARKALKEDSREWWDSHVEDEEYPSTAEGLAQFIRETLEPICMRMEKEARYQPAIKAQTLGEGLHAHRLEKLNRYETHLDRKFERTLAMLLKLKDLRSRGNLNIPD
jgi:hypothetical protein